MKLNEYGESRLVELLLRSRGILTPLLKECIISATTKEQNLPSNAGVTPLMAATMTVNLDALNLFKAQGYKPSVAEFDFAKKSYPNSSMCKIITEMVTAQEAPCITSGNKVVSVRTERLGVVALDMFFSENGWLFREQMIHDFGIDAHVEIIDGNYPTGDLIGIQIKSGKSFFSEEDDNSYVFRTQDKHIGYWTKHSLPVILVLYHPDKKQLFWQKIDEETVFSTGKNWKVSIPKSQVLIPESLAILKRLTQPEPYIRRLNKLRLDRSWIETLASGEDVFVEFADWINKSLPRYQLRLSSKDNSEVWPMTYMPDVSIEEMIEYSLPWANFELDLEAHRDGQAGQWSAECYVGTDKETGEVYYRESFEEWYNEPDPSELIPIEKDGECEHYRLKLSLNEVGDSFLELDSFLSQNDKIDQKSFTEKDLSW